MKKPSLFKVACSFVNAVPVGNTFTSKEYISVVGKQERTTRWKVNSMNPHYTSHHYKTTLKNSGFIANVKHGIWKVERHIPNWFSSGHAQVLAGYALSFNGMNRTDIIAQCDENARYAMGLVNRPIPTEDEPGDRLPKLRKANRETYQRFIWNAKEYGFTEFRTQNELAAYIENLKWPGVGNDGTKPRYAIQGNYSRIINHLMADGILTRKMVNNRWVYAVHITKDTQPKEKIRANVSVPDANVKVKPIGWVPTHLQYVYSPAATRIAENSTYAAPTKSKESLLQRLREMETAVGQLQIQLQMIIKEIK